MFYQAVHVHRLGGVGNERPFDSVLSREHFYRKLSKSVGVRHGWLGSRVVSVLDSGAKGPGFKSQS